MNFRWPRVALTRVATLVLLAGCAGQSGPGGALPAQSGGAAPAIVFVANAAAHACKGQKNSAKYATVTESLSKGGSLVCVPSFGGYGGSLRFPGVTPPMKVTLTSSTTAYNGIPYPIQSNAQFILQLTFSATPTFSGKVGPGGAIFGKAIKSKQTYNVYDTNYQFGFWHVITDCTDTAKHDGTLGGSLGRLGDLLKGGTMYSQWAFFVYSGSGASAC